MNEHDRKNVNFIMSLNESGFDAWAAKISDDDMQYAMEILRQSRLELAEQEHALLETELEDSNLAEANAVLSKFRL